MGLMQVFRSMRQNDDGSPKCQQSARGLGVRARGDGPIDPQATYDLVVDHHGLVHPVSGGMSVAPNHPKHLERHRRPAEFRGTGKDPVFVTAARSLGEAVTYRADPERAETHGFVEPTRTMLLADYRSALALTAKSWRKVNAEDYRRD